MSNLTRDQIILSNTLADLLTKTDMLLSVEELRELSADVDRWRDEQPGDSLIDAYQDFIQAIIAEVQS